MYASVLSTRLRFLHLLKCVSIFCCAHELHDVMVLGSPRMCFNKLLVCWFNMLYFSLCFELASDSTDAYEILPDSNHYFLSV